MKKTIVFIAIVTVIIAILTFAGCANPNNNIEEFLAKDERTIYLKWSDGEEKLDAERYSLLYDNLIEIICKDGTVIKTGYDNVIIIEK